jgi:hypothetical protein
MRNHGSPHGDPRSFRFERCHRLIGVAACRYVLDHTVMCDVRLGQAWEALKQRVNRWHGASWGRGGGNGFDADPAAPLPAKRSAGRSRRSAWPRTWRPTVRAARQPLPGDKRSPARGRSRYRCGWHEGRPTAKRYWMRAGGRGHRSFVPEAALATAATAISRSMAANMWPTRVVSTSWRKTSRTNDLGAASRPVGTPPRRSDSAIRRVSLLEAERPGCAVRWVQVWRRARK